MLHENEWLPILPQRTEEEIIGEVSFHSEEARLNPLGREIQLHGIEHSRGPVDLIVGHDNVRSDVLVMHFQAECAEFHSSLCSFQIATRIKCEQEPLPLAILNEWWMCCKPFIDRFHWAGR